MSDFENSSYKIYFIASEEVPSKDELEKCALNDFYYYSFKSNEITYSFLIWVCRTISIKAKPYKKVYIQIIKRWEIK